MKVAKLKNIQVTNGRYGLAYEPILTKKITRMDSALKCLQD
jgi:hypothetical protein